MATIYLDLDGTLIDVRLRHYAAYADAARAAGAEPLAERPYWVRRGAGASAADLVDAPARGPFRPEWLERIERPDYLAIDTLLPGVTRALAELRERHELTLATMRHDRAALDGQLADLGMQGYFSGVLTPMLDASTKGALIRAAGLAADGMVVGDTEADVEAARELGLLSVCVLTGLRSRSFLRQHSPDYLIDSVTGLPALLTGIRLLALDLA